MVQTDFKRQNAFPSPRKCYKETAFPGPAPREKSNFFIFVLKTIAFPRQAGPARTVFLKKLEREVAFPGQAGPGIVAFPSSL